MEGWIKLHRKLNNTSFKNKPLIVALFIDLLTNANHTKRTIIWNSKEMTIEAGQLVTGRKALAKRTGISEQSIRTGLVTLKSTNTITISSTSKFSVITILNWNTYQISTNELTNNQPTTNQQPTTNKNDNNDKNVKEERHLSYLINLPLEDITSFTKKYTCTDRQVSAKASQLYDYCQSKGRFYKDYKAFLRSALSKDFGERIPTQQFHPDLPEISEEERQRNIEKIKEIKSNLLTHFKTT